MNRGNHHDRIIVLDRMKFQHHLASHRNALAYTHAAPPPESLAAAHQLGMNLKRPPP